MGIWADVIKVIRSSVFKKELSNGNYSVNYATSAGSVNGSGIKVGNASTKKVSYLVGCLGTNKGIEMPKGVAEIYADAGLNMGGGYYVNGTKVIDGNKNISNIEDIQTQTLTAKEAINTPLINGNKPSFIKTFSATVQGFKLYDGGVILTTGLSGKTIEDVLGVSLRVISNEGAYNERVLHFSGFPAYIDNYNNARFYLTANSFYFDESDLSSWDMQHYVLHATVSMSNDLKQLTFAAQKVAHCSVSFSDGKVADYVSPGDVGTTAGNYAFGKNSTTTITVYFK